MIYLLDMQNLLYIGKSLNSSVSNCPHLPTPASAPNSVIGEQFSPPTNVNTIDVQFVMNIHCN